MNPAEGQVPAVRSWLSMRLGLSVVAVLSLLVLGCSGQTPARASAGASSQPTAPTPTPSTSAEIASAGLVVTIVDTHLFTAASLRVIELGGTPCVRQKEVEPDIAAYHLDEEAATLAGPEGVIADGRAYVGSLRSAAKAFNASEVLQRNDGGAVVVIGRATGVQDVPEGAPIGYVLEPIALKGGQTAWVRIGTYVASVPCSPNES